MKSGLDTMPLFLLDDLLKIEQIFSEKNLLTPGPHRVNFILLHFVVWKKMNKIMFCCFVVLLFDKKPMGFVNKIWILLTKYGFFVLLFWYKIAKYFLILLVYWFFTFCSVLLFSRTAKSMDYSVNWRWPMLSSCASIWNLVLFSVCSYFFYKFLKYYVKRSSGKNGFVFKGLSVFVWLC